MKKQRGEIVSPGAFVVGYDTNGDMWASVDIDNFGEFCDKFDEVQGSADMIMKWIESRNQ